MDEILAADRPDLAGGEEAGQGDGAEQIGQDAGVVVGLVEQPRCPGRCR